MAKTCRALEKKYQKWPNAGKLKENLNLSFLQLNKKVKKKDNPGIVYQLSSLERDNGKIFQTGCGPNFEGGLITLCTCRSDIRTWRKSKEEWMGTWIAGISGISDTKHFDKNYLFYLMRIGQVYDSQKEIWEHLPKVRDEKNTRNNPLGDIYEPRPNCSDKYKVGSYYKPQRKHVHFKYVNRKKDINITINKKRPYLLVGDINYSFLWNKKKLYCPKAQPRHKKWDNGIEEFLLKIKEIE